MASKIDAAITSFMIDWKLLKFTFPGETELVFFAKTCSLARVWSLARQERKNPHKPDETAFAWLRPRL